jgi:choline monooxygenase
MKPSHFYFDNNILAKEQILFNQARYIGHELLVPGLANFHTLPQDNQGRMLIHNSNGIECLSNVCRHRQATILHGHGHNAQIVCPLHGWSYDNHGKLMGAPFFDPCPERHLTKYSTQTWNGVIFELGQNIIPSLKEMNLARYFSFNNYAFHSRQIHNCNYNWKTFIEVYLEDYHVNPFHQGLGNFVDCANLKWQFNPRFSVQSVGIKQKLKLPGTPVYKTWHKAVLDRCHGNMPDYGAIWLLIYPNVMIEWYPEVLVISTVWPESPERTLNIIDFYYPEEVCHFESDFVAAHQAAYMETCYEDDEIAERIDQGRGYLNSRHTNDSGPVHDPMEIGLDYFHDYYDRWIFSDQPQRERRILPEDPGSEGGTLD